MSQMKCPPVFVGGNPGGTAELISSLVLFETGDFFMGKTPEYLERSL